MPYINLIHEQRAFQRQEQQKIRVAGFAFMSSIAVSVIGMGTLFLMGEGVRGEIASVKSLLTRIQPIMNDIDDANREYAALTPRLTSLEDAQSITRHWTNALDHFSKNVPQGVWLTNMRSQQKAKDGNVEVTLTGLSLKQEGVADLMLRMKSLKDFSDVQLKFTQEDRNPDLSTVRYEVLAKIPDKAAKPTDTKKKGSFSDRRNAEKEATS